MKKNQYIFKALKCIVFCVFYMTFYNLQNSVKFPPQNAGNGISETLETLDVFRAFVPRFVAPRFLILAPPPFLNTAYRRFS